MTTAREQARSAAKHRHIDTNEDTLLMMERDADAASDVWEPIVRELFHALFLAMPVGEAHYKIQRAYDNAKEALGE